MNNMIAVGLGGFIGAVARYKISGWFLHRTGSDTAFPLGTFLVNLTGCLLIGLLAGAIEERHLFGFNLRLFVITGLLGGFTTYSAFGFETFSLMKRQAVATAFFYLAATVIGGLFLVAVGEKIGKVVMS